MTVASKLTFTKFDDILMDIPLQSKAKQEDTTLP